jgi:hypothetical protein
MTEQEAWKRDGLFTRTDPEFGTNGTGTNRRLMARKIDTRTRLYVEAF